MSKEMGFDSLPGEQRYWRSKGFNVLFEVYDVATFKEAYEK